MIIIGGLAGTSTHEKLKEFLTHPSIRYVSNPARFEQMCKTEEVSLCVSFYDSQTSLEIFRRLRQAKPVLNFILLADVSSFSKKFQKEADELNVFILDVESFIDLLRENYHTAGEERVERPQVEKHGRLVLVVSDKGGVGKTTFAVNLARYLALRGKRTAILDLEFEREGGGDVARVFGYFTRIEASASAKKAFATVEKFNNFVYTKYDDFNYLEKFLTKIEDNLYFLSIAAHEEQLMDYKRRTEQDPENNEIVEAIYYMLYHFDVVVVDTSPQIHELYLYLMRQADKIYYVLEPTAHIVDSTIARFEAYGKRMISLKNFALVVNKSRSERISDLEFLSIQTGIPERDIYQIPFLPNLQNPFDILSNAQGKKAFENIYAGLFPEEGKKVQTPNKRGGFFSIFRRNRR
ncbi:MAG: AAA family ATPase [Brockia lithotrophica]|nr:AAA family ATPase [Brockia lithotrophica]